MKVHEWIWRGLRCELRKGRVSEICTLTVYSEPRCSYGYHIVRHVTDNGKVHLQLRQGLGYAYPKDLTHGEQIAFDIHVLRRAEDYFRSYIFL